MKKKKNQVQEIYIPPGCPTYTTKLISPPGINIFFAASSANCVVSETVVIVLSPPGRYPKLNATSLEEEKE